MEKENKGFCGDNSKENSPEVPPNEVRIPVAEEEEIRADESYFKPAAAGTKDRKGFRDKKPGPASVSCVIQLNTMWYNFAAPPQTPITRKIDYTRYPCPCLISSQPITTTIV